MRGKRSLYAPGGLSEVDSFWKDETGEGVDMKTAIILTVLLVLAGCGYSHKDGELIGQPKKVIHATPLICPDYIEADISLGVLRNGVGSMSTQDVWIVIDSQQEKFLKSRVESGKLVKIRYDEWRVAPCKD